MEYGAQRYFPWRPGLAVRRQFEEGEDKGKLLLTDTAEEELGLKGQDHGIRILHGWRERWEQAEEEAARRQEEAHKEEVSEEA